MVGGGNDILRPKADLDAIAARLEAAVVRLREAGADVLLATPTDPAGAPVLRHLRGRHAIHSANLFSIAQQHGAYVINQWGMKALQDFRLWSEDRIHMTTEGHRRVALNALSALGHDTDRADWSTPLPPAPPLARREAAAANAEWARTHLAPWVQRRLKGESSGDTVRPSAPSSCTCAIDHPPDRADLGPADLRDSSTRTSYYYPWAMPATRLMPTDEATTSSS